jgi:DNA-binding transcriptional regulator YiaG
MSAIRKGTTKKAPNPIDKHVGSRMRMRRMMLAMSQEKLADGLGLTFQQVQKYEKGTNRISASRLREMTIRKKRPRNVSQPAKLVVDIA